MEAFFAYLIKSAICLTLFLLVYIIFFRRTTFIVFNRVYLLCGLLASLVIPFYHFSYDVIISAPTFEINYAPAGGTPVAVEQGISWWQAAIFVYIIGTAVLIIRNLIAYLRFTKLIRSGEKHSSGGIKFVNNKRVKSPFTVLNYIVLDSTTLSPTEESLIIKHEITHVKQKHWIDLICGECMLVLQWFNPLVWLYVSLQKENHEFLADKAVLDGGASPAIYQAVLINRQFGGPVFSFSNSFNYSKPLTRLIMMKKTKSSPLRKVALLILIPVFGVFLWVTAKPNYVVQDNKPSIFEGQFALDTIFIGELKPNSPLVIINGEEHPDINISLLDPSYFESLNVLKDGDAVKKYGDKGKNGVVEITLKKGYDYSALKKKKRTITYHGTMKLDDDQVKAYHNDDKLIMLTVDTANFNNTGEMNDLEGTVYSTISTRTNNNDTAKVRVITKIIKTGKENNQIPLNINVETLDARGEKPLIVKDNKEISLDEMKAINPHEIESISVLKDKSGTVVYGDKGKNGVIIITTKKKE